MKKNSLSEIERDYLLVKEKDATPDKFPRLFNISNAFFYQFKARPVNPKKPEFIYLPEKYLKYEDTKYTKNSVFVAQWNLCWESAQIRYDLFKQAKQIPDDFSWIEKYSESNIYFLPPKEKYSYYSYSSLYNLLPVRLLKINNLPLLHINSWPYNFYDDRLEQILPPNYKDALAYCFAQYVWPLINNCNKISAFSKNDPIKLLAHNLDFWLPFITKAIEERMKQNTLVPYENKRQLDSIKKLQKKVPPGIIIDRPVKGGDVWYGEAEAWDMAKSMVQYADKQCNLFGIIDAIKRDRIEDDFSDKWSYEKEDFERKIYRKRSKYKVNFVELKETDAVIGPETEIYEKLFWEDFIALLNQKEKRIVILLKSGYTKLEEISKEMGYANHSPISKALKKIRCKLTKYLE